MLTGYLHWVTHWLSYINSMVHEAYNQTLYSIENLTEKH